MQEGCLLVVPTRWALPTDPYDSQSKKRQPSPPAMGCFLEAVRGMWV